jgi:hypothetical protein
VNPGTKEENTMSVSWDESFDPDLFSADEIDRMEAVMLDSMDPEALKAYKSRIMRTLKAIKVQEQLWKERTTILLDMKEEAEYLIDDLS